MTNKNTLDGKVERIRQEYKNGTHAKKLAGQHGVSEQSIYNAANGRTYKGQGGTISHRNQPVTETEKVEMRQRFANGEDVKDIAAQMGRSYQVVYYWRIVKAGVE